MRELVLPVKRIKCDLNNNKLKHDAKINKLFAFVLIFDIVSLGVNTFVNQFISYGTIWDSLILYVLLMIYFANAFMSIVGRLKAKTLIYIFVSFILFLVNLLLHFDNRVYIEIYEIWNLVVYLLIMLALGAAITNFNDLYERIARVYWIAIIAAAVHLYFGINSDASTWMSDMTSGYALLPVALFAIDYAFHKRIAWIWAIAAFIISFLLGSRGPVLLILVFLTISLLRYSNNLKKKMMLIAVIAAVTVFISSGYFIDYLTNLSATLENNNIRVASLIKILEYSDFSNGRNVIYTQIYNAIWESPVLGSGVFYDRSISAYAHNIFLELWLDFGVVIGTAIIGWLVVHVVRLIRRCTVTQNANGLAMVLLIICTIFGELMFSSSYLREPLFFVLIGMFSSNGRLASRAGVKKWFSRGIIPLQKGADDCHGARIYFSRGRLSQR
jgi:hypothetical protein